MFHFRPGIAPNWSCLASWQGGCSKQARTAGNVINCCSCSRSRWFTPEWTSPHVRVGIVRLLTFSHGKLQGECHLLTDYSQSQILYNQPANNSRLRGNISSAILAFLSMYWPMATASEWPRYTHIELESTVNLRPSLSWSRCSGRDLPLLLPCCVSDEMSLNFSSRIHYQMPFIPCC